jgi:hypothetical protein
MLLPYKGPRREEHLGPDGRGSHAVAVYGADRTKKITYHFNSLGFRGEEFDPQAQLKLFVCGCSFTFGTGLEIEDSWAFRLKQKLAEHRGLAVSSANLSNFSQGGASNDYITRTLIEQSARVRPDVIVAGFTHMSRFELLDETMATAFHFQPTQPAPLEKYERAGGRFAELGRLAKFQFLGTDDTQTKIRMIKNILLLQYFCRQRDIPFLFYLFESLARDDLPEALSQPMTAPLFGEIDFDLMVPLEPEVDWATDGAHPGRRSQELMAEAAMKTFRSRYT